MNSHREEGVTIIEILVAIVLLTVFVVASSNMVIGMLKTNNISRQRTSASTAMEGWVERYKSGAEPMSAAGTACVGSSTSFTCTYPNKWDYATDGITSHQNSSAILNARFQPFSSVIAGTQTKKGSNRELWALTVRVTDPVNSKTVEANTYVTK